MTLDEIVKLKARVLFAETLVKARDGQIRAEIERRETIERKANDVVATSEDMECLLRTECDLRKKAEARVKELEEENRQLREENDMLTELVVRRGETG